MTPERNTATLELIADLYKQLAATQGALAEALGGKAAAEARVQELEELTTKQAKRSPGRGKAAAPKETT